MSLHQRRYWQAVSCSSLLAWVRNPDYGSCCETICILWKVKNPFLDFRLRSNVKDKRPTLLPLGPRLPLFTAFTMLLSSVCMSTMLITFVLNTIPPTICLSIPLNLPPRCFSVWTLFPAIMECELRQRSVHWPLLPKMQFKHAYSCLEGSHLLKCPSV